MRHRKRLPWQNGQWISHGKTDPRVGWVLLTALGFGIAFVCSFPLAGRIALLGHLDGYVRTTLTVQSITQSRRSLGADRHFAHGLLATGGTGSIRLTHFAPQPLPTLRALEAHVGRSPAVLDVMVNESLAQGWLRRDRLRRYDPDLRAHTIGLVGQLAAWVLAGLGLAVWGWVRYRRAPRRGHRQRHVDCREESL